MLYPDIFAPPLSAARYKASSKALFFDKRGVFSSITDLPVTSTNFTCALTIIGNSKNITNIKDQIKKVKKVFFDEPITAKRRTSIEKIKDIEEISFDSILEKEPITIVCSKMGWIRSLRGHIDLNQDLKFKDGDEKGFIFHAETTDKILAFGANGRFYTIACSNLPGGRGMGEPVRLIIDLPNESNIVDLFVYDETKKLLVASDVGDGFIVPENEVIAQTKNGKQVLNLASDLSLIHI